MARKNAAETIDRPLASSALTHASGVTEFVKKRHHREFAGHHDAMFGADIVTRTTVAAVHVADRQLRRDETVSNGERPVQLAELVLALIESPSPGP